MKSNTNYLLIGGIIIIVIVVIVFVIKSINKDNFAETDDGPSSCRSVSKSSDCQSGEDFHLNGEGWGCDGWNGECSYSKTNPQCCKSRKCRADKECRFDDRTSTCVGITGVKSEECKYAGTDTQGNVNVCTCDNPDPLAPQCTSDNDCIYGAGVRSKSRDQNKGSHNCKIYGTESQCRTPLVQCENNGQCHLRGICRSDTPGSAKCIAGSFMDVMRGDSCVCKGDLGDAVNYNPNNPNNYQV